MTWLTPELVQAVGISIATVVGAVTAWQAREVKKLRARVDALEEQAAHDHTRFRAAIRLIRDLLQHIDDLRGYLRQHAAEADPPPHTAPEIPAVLAEEI